MLKKINKENKNESCKSLFINKKQFITKIKFSIKEKTIKNIKEEMVERVQIENKSRKALKNAKIRRKMKKIKSWHVFKYP